MTSATSLVPFDYAPRTRVIFGPGTVRQLPTLVSEYGGKSVFLVTDPGLREAGHSARTAESLIAAGLKVTTYDEVTPNPTESDVAKATEVARASEIDLIVGLGGGSSMDCAKGVNFVLTNGGRMRDYHGVGKASKPMLPMIAIPTTSGTGSEAQCFALISQDETHVKMACGDPKAACIAAILDPDLTESVPRSILIATGLDALSHALETAVTRVRTPVSQIFSRNAWQLLAKALPQSLQSNADPDVRGEMLLGSHLAGAAIENSMLGAAHALANPLTATYGITHGIAVGLMLPHVLRFNAPSVGAIYDQLAEDANPGSEHQGPSGSESTGAERIAAFLNQLLATCGIANRLEEHDVPESDLPKLAEAASQQWTGTFNPRAVDIPSLQEIYTCAWN